MIESEVLREGKQHSIAVESYHSPTVKIKHYRPVARSHILLFTLVILVASKSHSTDN